MLWNLPPPGRLAPAMKSKLLLASALALAVALLLPQTSAWQETGLRDVRQVAENTGEKAAEEGADEGVQARAPGRSITPDAPPVAGIAASHAGAAHRLGRHQALHDVRRVHWTSSEAPVHPRQALMPAGPASGADAAAGSASGAGPLGAAARPALAAPDTPDWRDSARELLSQIGVLCPVAGCDSLEDD